MAQAKSWYESNYPVSAAAKSSLAAQSIPATVKSTGDLSQLIKPDWQNAAKYNRLGKSVIEMPVDPGVNFGSDIKNATANKAYSNKKYNRSYYLLLNDGKTYQAFIMMIMADSTYVNNNLGKLANNSYRKHDADFSGLVLYFTPTGQYAGGYAYQKGKLVQPATAGSSKIANQSINTKLKTNEVEACVDWYLDTYIDDELVSSQYLYTECNGTNSGGGGGSSTPPPPVCPSGSGSSGAEPDVAAPINNPISDPGDGGYAPPPTTTTECPVNNPAPPPDTVTTKTPDPCTQVNTLANNTPFLTLMNNLKNNTNQSYEDAYTYTISSTGDVNANAFQGPPNTSDVSLSFPNGAVDGFIHDHYAGDFPTFSGADIYVIYNMMIGGEMKNPSTFTAGVVTAAGTTYLIKISNVGLFNTFGNSNLNNITNLNTFLDKYDNAVLKNQGNGNNNIISYELALMQILNNSGLTLFKGSSNFSSWTPITNVNNVETTTNCNGN